ncbi:MAG TPA: hypothetical protein VFC21_13085 [Bryobacteraceae bacterium]|nr:hypothetical protein [Bryobacteraceae bacterium]
MVTGLVIRAASSLSPGNLAWVRSTVCDRPKIFALAQEFFASEVLIENHDFVRQKLGRFGEPEAKDNREIGSIVSTAVTQTSFIGNGAISKNLAVSSFLFRELRQLRLIVGAALNELMDEQKTRGLPCLFLLEDAFDIARDYALPSGRFCRI